MFEEAETVLYEEDVAHSLIDCALFDFPIFQSRWKLVAIQVADHLHIQASVDGSHGRVSWIGSETVRCQILDGLPIGYHETCEVPALAKNIVQQPAISCSRHTIKVHVAAHQRTGTSLDASVERGQVDILQLLVGNVGLLIVTAACGGAIPGKMLKAGEQMVGRADVIALEPPDLSLRHPGTEIRTSPAPSIMRPHRGSRAISSIGANVQLIPVAEASRAAISCVCSTSAGSQDPASASGMG